MYTQATSHLVEEKFPIELVQTRTGSSRHFRYQYKK